MAESFPPPNFIPTESAVPGIEVYKPAPVDAPQQQEVVAFDCPQCGATTAFSAAGGGLTCSHCGYYEAPKEAAVGKRAEKYEFTTETMQRNAQREAQRAAQGWDAGRKEMACQNCGALTSVPPENLTTTCPFCGSNKVIQREAPQDVLRPRFVIPFKIEAAQCASIARGWLGSSWMTPKALQSGAALANFIAVYLPFWTFSAATRAAWKAEVGHQETQRYFDNGEWKTRTVTRWRWESGEGRLKIEDLLVEGTARLSALLMGKIKNFDMSALAAYEPKFLAGLQAQAYDIPLEKAWETGRQQMREKTRQVCLGQASTSQVRNFSMNMDFDEESWRYLLLPIYINTYRYENKVFQIMVNGQTGAIAGQRPVDWNKVWLAIAALQAPGILICLVGLITAMFGVGLFIGAVGFILLIIGLVIGVILFTQAQSLDDA